MGACTIANRREGVSVDGLRVVEVDVTYSASYATGGDSISPSLLGLKEVRQILVPSHKLNGMGAVANANSRTGKSVQLAGTASAPLLALYETANTEVANATNVSTVVHTIRFLGS